MKIFHIDLQKLILNKIFPFTLELEGFCDEDVLLAKSVSAVVYKHFLHRFNEY